MGGDTGPEVVQRVAWCTGGGQVLSIAPRVLAWMLLLLAKFLTDHSFSPRAGIAFLCCRSPSTERGGIRALSEWLNENTDLM